VIITSTPGHPDCQPFFFWHEKSFLQQKLMDGELACSARRMCRTKNAQFLFIFKSSLNILSLSDFRESFDWPTSDFWATGKFFLKVKDTKWGNRPMSNRKSNVSKHNSCH
jgi:hypothetical protein